MDNKNGKKEMIKELQKLAEEVLKLKTDHSQKRPIVIEFSGSPKSGKSSCINSLELFLKRNGFSVQIVQERASVCPVTDKHSPMFNIWTACTSLAGLIGVLENKKNKVDVLILDRGVFDSLCWFRWLVSTYKMEKKQEETLETFLLMEEIIKNIDIVFAFFVPPNISIEREYANLLTDKPGSIMNKKVLEEYNEAVKSVIKEKKEYFRSVFEIDTSQKNQDEAGKEVTQKTLETLKDLLTERIGYFKKNKELINVLRTEKYTSHDKIKTVLPEIGFDFRNNVEENSELLQVVPIATIMNKDKTKILVIKKNKDAASKNSPEKDKMLLYVGGHMRIEDCNNIKRGDFVAICRTTLKREVKEEIGISIALDNIEPFYIYNERHDKSKRHLAVCFPILLDDEGTKLRLDKQELVLNKGTSKSGKFWDLKELSELGELEEWSNIIVKEYLGISDEQLNNNKQIAFFE